MGTSVFTIILQPGYFRVFCRCSGRVLGAVMSYQLPVYSPTQLNMYRACPHRYYRKYVRKDMPPEPFSPAMARGGVAHKLLQHGFRRFAGRGDFPTDIEERARGYLLSYDYQNREQFEKDVRSIVEWVRFAFNSFDPRCRIVLVERQLDYTQRNSAGNPLYRLLAQIDLLVEHPGGRFEHIDWKTSRAMIPDPIQTLISFIVVHEHLKVTPRDIRTSVAFLTHRRALPIDTSRETVRPIWDEIRHLIGRIRSGTDWGATRNDFCAYCPLNENGCPLEPVNYLDLDA
jgi:hypothetical protein